MTSSAACSVAVLVIEPAKMPSVCPTLMPNTCPSPSATSEAGDDTDQGQQIVFAPCRARHAFEELPAVENADSVEEHDQAGEADRSDDLGLRREGADGEADEKNGADTERKAAEIDLTDQVADADREKRRKNRLCPNDVTGEIQHFDYLLLAMDAVSAINGRGTPPRGIAPITRLIKVGRRRVAYRHACIQDSSPST